MAPDWRTAILVWPAILAQALILGSAVLCLLLGSRASISTRTDDTLVRALTPWWRAFALIIFVLFPFKLVYKTAAMADVPLRAAVQLVPEMLRETHAGRVWTWQWPVALALVVAAWLPMRGPSWALALTMLCATLALMRSFTSHAIDYGPAAVSVRFVHEAAAGLWAGSLFGCWRGAHHAGIASRFAAEAVAALSQLAAWSVLILIVSGSYIAYKGIGFSPAALAHSTYGQVLIVKLAAFALILGIGGYNRYFLIPILDRSAARRTLIRNVGYESLAMVAVMALATLLANTAPARMTVAPVQMTRISTVTRKTHLSRACAAAPASMLAARLALTKETSHD